MLPLLLSRGSPDRQVFKAWHPPGAMFLWLREPNDSAVRCGDVALHQSVQQVDCVHVQANKILCAEVALEERRARLCCLAKPACALAAGLPAESKVAVGVRSHVELQDALGNLAAVAIAGVVGRVLARCASGSDRKSTRLNSSHVEISY